MYSAFIKPIFDFLISISLIILLFPLLLFVIILLFITYQGNPFFTQQRPGKHSRNFKVIKFKTMNDSRNHEGFLLPDKDRLTQVGRILRLLSIDELPQLINVLKGDMSLVGPRPLLVKYLSLYTPVQARRHEVRPGITGWTQVNGRNSITWSKKFELDVWYVDNISFLLDVKILWLTLIKVFKREGINSANAATMEEFTGNN